MTSPAAWHPDPSGRHELRYWDGQQWTQHVANHGVQSVDFSRPAPTPAATSATPAAASSSASSTGPQAFTGGSGQPAGGVAPSVNPFDTSGEAERIRRQVSDGGHRGAGIVDTPQGGGTLFTEPVLVVNQKAKLIEIVNQYSVYDAQGRQIGAVNQVGQSTAKKVLRALTNVDQFLTHRFEIVDANQQVVLRITRPKKLIKSTVIVADAADNEIGRIVQENAIGKIHFALEAGGQKLGSIRAENWRAWDFAIQDAGGNEIARIKKTWEGLAKTLFTSADNYVLRIHYALQPPLLQLVVASALTVDTALKQDSRGFN